MTLAPFATTAIGSLPHREIAPALAAAFALDIPSLPSLPGRSPTELLVAQGLSGLPGLSVNEAGRCSVDPDLWRRGRLAFQKVLTRAIDDPAAETEAAPSTDAFAAWDPFIRQVALRRTALAKVQLVGPLTAARHALLFDGRMLGADLPIANQVFQLLAARALAMIAALRRAGARPLFFFDEPALTGLSLGQARNLMALQELRTSVSALRRAGALVGLHCCGEAQWERLLPLGFDLLSFDAARSLASLLRRREELEAFASTGGRLALGIIPTTAGAVVPEPEALAAGLWEAFAQQGELDRLRTALLTPACGLAGHSEAAAGALVESLVAVKSALVRRAALA